MKYSFFLFWILFFLIGIAGHVIFHEQTHGQIFASYGSEVSYEFNGITAYTYGTCPPDSTCEFEQNLTEIVGYHMFALLLNAWIIFLLIMMYKIFKEET